MKWHLNERQLNLAITNLNCSNLGALDDGAAGHVINAAIREAIADLEDRGEDGKPRQVNIVLEMTKDQGLIIAHVQAGAKIPKRRTGNTSGKIVMDGKQPAFQFSEMAPDDPTQTTIDQYER